MSPQPANAFTPRAMLRYLPALAVVSLAVIVRSASWLNCDDSWLLTLDDRILHGARPYIDFSEPNPPASFLIYMPAILIGDASGISAEFILSALTFFASFLSIWMVGKILSQNNLVEYSEKPVLAALACAVLLILPGDAFAQREHIALLALLPTLAVYAVRASGASVGSLLAGVAGAGAGIAVAIKPHFALALILPLLYVAWRQRERQRQFLSLIFEPEHVTAFAVVLVYAALVVWRYSDYLYLTLPTVLILYVALKYSPLVLLGNPSVVLFGMTMIVGLGLGIYRSPSPVSRAATFAAFGFVSAIFIQGKGWPYHGYPALALAFFAVSILLIEPFRQTENHIATPSRFKDFAFGSVLLVATYALSSYWLLIEPDPAQLVSEVGRVAPLHPKILSINGGPELAFPLTRKLQGTAVGRAPFQWISEYADILLSTHNLSASDRQKIEELGRLDRHELSANIHLGEPDVILIGSEGDKKYAFSNPEIASALQTYQRVDAVGDVEIWLRIPAPGHRN